MEDYSKHKKEVSAILDLKTILNRKENKYEKFYKHPNKYIPINELGDLYLNWFNERYAALRMIKNLPIFNKAYKLLTERKNFSRNNAFGEMHCDGFLWVIKHDKIKVIVEERQSYKYIYIDNGSKFHIRALDYHGNYPAYRRNELKGISEIKFKKQGFQPYCPKDVNTQRFGAFTYGDSRDEGYIMSMEYWLKGHEQCDYANSRTIAAAQMIEYWIPYLDNPDELE